jgi:hypothetical protein
MNLSVYNATYYALYPLFRKAFTANEAYRMAMAAAKAAVATAAGPTSLNRGV